MKPIKLILTAVLALASIQVSQASGTQKAKFLVKVTNLTAKQVLTPPVVAVHSRRFNLFEVGEAAGDSLVLLAEEGVTKDLVEELTANTSKVEQALAGEEAILPEESAEFVVTIRNPRVMRLSVVTKLATTNDAFAAVDAVRFPSDEKEFTSEEFDAGSEKNSELCSTIPGEPCDGVGVRDPEVDGVVTKFEGIQGVGDLDATEYAVRSGAALVTVKQIQ